MEIFNFVKNSIGLYFNYDKSLPEFEENISFKRVLLSFTGIAFLCYMILNILEDWNVESTFYMKMRLLFEYVFLDLISFLVMLFVIYLIVFGVLKLYKSQISFLQVIKYGLSVQFFVFVFNFLIQVILNLIYIFRGAESDVITSVDMIMFSVYGILMIITCIFSFIVYVKTFSDIGKLSKGKTVITMLTPAIIISIIIFSLWYIFKDYLVGL